MSAITIALPDCAATEAAGARLASTLTGGLVITLSGDLGTGKTTLVRGLLRSLGWTAAVKSPTYALVEYYALSSLYLYHFDLYRLESTEGWDTGGFSECFGDDSVCVIEWPERAGSRLPQADLALLFELPADVLAQGRMLSAVAHSAAGERCRQAMIGAIGSAVPAR